MSNDPTADITPNSRERTDGESAFTWTATVRFSRADSADVVDLTSFDQRIRESLAGRIAAVRRRPGSLSLSFGVRGADLGEATHDLSIVLKTIESEVGLDSTGVTGTQLRHNDHLDAALDATQHVGVVEAAEILGVSKQRVGQLAQREDFPAPRFRLRATPVWLEDEIRAFGANRRTLPGAPRKSAVLEG